MLLLLASPAFAEPHDLVIYGGTSAGIAAAVQAKRMGLSAIVIEPTDRIGGLTTGGLGQTDIGNKNVIGGIAARNLLFIPSASLAPLGRGRRGFRGR
jgi:NADPH-dependent 2,4-dienoyl-CoA reductase/sulfur reductase-like enzyme